MVFDLHGRDESCEVGLWEPAFTIAVLGRMTGNSEVIGSSFRLVLTTALVLIEFRGMYRFVSKPEVVWRRVKLVPVVFACGILARLGRTLSDQILSVSMQMSPCRGSGEAVSCSIETRWVQFHMGYENEKLRCPETTGRGCWVIPPENCPTRCLLPLVLAPPKRGFDRRGLARDCKTLDQLTFYRHIKGPLPSA